MTIRSIARTALVSTLIVLGGCASMNPFSSKSARNEPAPLVNFKTSMVVSTVWSIDIGQSGNYMFTPSLSDNKLFVASAEGTVACVDIGSGKFVWRINAGTALTAGVGTDGSAVVVAGTDGTLLSFSAVDGKRRWKIQASSEILSAPAVSRGTVVVRSQDNRIAAYDAESGARRWFLQRPSPALALRTAAGIVIAGDDVLIAMPAGRLLALSLANGAPRWESVIAEPRGATELERIADVAGTPVLAGRDVCAAAYQGRVACGDLTTGTIRWARELSAEAGPGMDERYVFATDERGNVHAFARETGASQWRNTNLAWRRLSAPVSFGRAVVVGDRQGYLHFLSREEGAMLARVATDGGAIKATPIVTGSSLIVQTDSGRLLALAAD